MAWINNHVFARKSFWQTEDASKFSPAIRSMLQLKHLLVDLLRCEIGDGQRACFWFDHWTELDPLINLLGPGGPRLLRIPIGARVISATSNGSWRLLGARSVAAHELQVHLTTIDPPTAAKGRDIFLWRNGTGLFVNKFSSKDTWDYLRDRSPVVSCNKAVWYKESIPRCYVMTWFDFVGHVIKTTNKGSA